MPGLETESEEGQEKNIELTTDQKIEKEIELIVDNEERITVERWRDASRAYIEKFKNNPESENLENLRSQFDPNGEIFQNYLKASMKTYNEKGVQDIHAISAVHMIQMQIVQATESR